MLRQTRENYQRELQNLQALRSQHIMSTPGGPPPPGGYPPYYPGHFPQYYPNPAGHAGLPPIPDPGKSFKISRNGFKIKFDFDTSMV